MKEQQKALLSKVAEYLVEYGFEKKPIGQSIIKIMPDGKVSFHLAFIDHKDNFDVVADVAIRFDMVENMVNEDNKLLSKKEKESTFTLGAELGNISQGSQKRWTVFLGTDVDSIAQEIRSAFVKYADSYIKKYSEMQNAFELLLSNDRQNWIHCPVHGARAKRVLSMAVLLNHQALIPKLISDSIAFLREQKDFGIQDYEKFSKRWRKV